MTISQAPSGPRETFGQLHLHTAPTMAMRGRESNTGFGPGFVGGLAAGAVIGGGYYGGGYYGGPYAYDGGPSALN